MTVRRSDGAARREALLDAALTCFEQRGLVRTGIEDIRKAAGASPSSVYHLFKGLPEIIAALLERTFERRFAAVTARVVKTRTAKSAVVALVDAHLAWVFANPGEARFMYQAIAVDLLDQHREEIRATKLVLKADLIAHLVKLGVGFGASDGMIDVVLLGMTHQACRAWLASPLAIDERWMRKWLPELAWRGTQETRPTRQKYRSAP